MDTSRPEGRVRGRSERDGRKPYERPVLHPLDGQGHIPRHSLLGSDDFDLNDIVHFDKLHNVIHILNKLDNIKLNFHHHHGPEVNDILIHNDDDCGVNNVVAGTYDDIDDFALLIYGPADHHHGSRGDDDDLSAAVDHDNYVG